MATRSPGGKSVGRTSIRVVPDSSRFREDLRKALERIERTEFVHIKPVLDDKGKTKFLHDVRKLTQDASNNKVNVAVAANTAAAAAQLRYTTRPRIVPLHVRISKRSLTTAATAIAALSGARVAANWVEDLSRSLGNIDKNLPKIGFVTTAITSLTSVLFASISGIVGIGAGLAAILPSLLVLPGLFAGLVTSAAILVIALADSSTQLASLSPHMKELTSIIRDGFWSQARQPILDLVNNLMPQLRNSFRETSIAIGGFIGGMATSFDKEFANGRFESIFAGMAKSFEILRTGTDGFAGALVSLFQIAANYVPRLSQWFVDIANRFDAWLKTTAEDGRMTQWIDGAIVAMNQLWRATTATGRVLQGLWRAAEAAGGGGLGGFADNMERIDRVVNGAAFQRGMTAIFRGAQTATAGLNVGLRALGRLLDQQRGAVEFFLGQTGIIFGRFFADIFDALNSDAIAKGLTDFTTGLADGFASFGTYLPKVADGLASLGSFAGELGRQLGPVLGATLAGVATVLSPLLDYLREYVLPTLGPALTSALEQLAPKLADVAEKLGPIVESLSILALELLPLLTEGLSGFADGFASDTRVEDKAANVMTAVGELVRFFTGSVQIIADLIAGNDITIEAAIGRYGVMWKEFQNFTYHTIENIKRFFRDLGQAGQDAITGLAMGLAQAVGTVILAANSVRDEVIKAFVGAAMWLVETGKDIVRGLVNGIRSLLGYAEEAGRAAGNAAAKGVAKAIDSHSPSRVAHKLGRFFTRGFGNGIREDIPFVAEAGRDAGQAAASAVAIPDFSGLGAMAASGGNTTWSPTFAIAPESGVPLADQVFTAARRLRARVA